MKMKRWVIQQKNGEYYMAAERWTKDINDADLFEDDNLEALEPGEKYVEVEVRIVKKKKKVKK